MRVDINKLKEAHTHPKPKNPHLTEAQNRISMQPKGIGKKN